MIFLPSLPCSKDARITLCQLTKRQQLCLFLCARGFFVGPNSLSKNEESTTGTAVVALLRPPKLVSATLYIKSGRHILASTHTYAQVLTWRWTDSQSEVTPFRYAELPPPPRFFFVLLFDLVVCPLSRNRNPAPFYHFLPPILSCIWLF